MARETAEMSSGSPTESGSRHMEASALRGEVGRHVFGLGIIALGCTFFVWGDFGSGMPVPADMPHRTAFAYVVAAALILIGADLQWRRYAAIAAAGLAVFYTLVVILLMNSRMLLAGYAIYGTYEVLSQQLAIAAAALVLYARCAPLSARLAARLTRISQVTFGVCALVWGGAHFVYMDLTAPLVPTWLPPSQIFWGYLTGVAFLAAGVAIVVRIQARIAAVLLTIMLATFTLLVHLRMVVAAHNVQFNWTELAANLALLGASWAVADSLAHPMRKPLP